MKNSLKKLIIGSFIFICVAMLSVFVIKNNPFLKADASNIEEVIDYSTSKANSINGTTSGSSVQDSIKTLQGEGTQENPYIITNEDDLYTFSWNVNNGKYTNSNVKLIKDLNFIGKEIFTPIGQRDGYSFSGTFDGGNYTISNITFGEDIYNIDNVKYNFSALFSFTTNANIKNVILENVAFSDSKSTELITQNSEFKYRGALVGDANAGTVISNCTLKGSVAFDFCAKQQFYGGFCGYLMNATIQNCLNNATITYNYAENSTAYIGGIVGRRDHQSIILNCFNTGDILANIKDCPKVNLTTYTGGIVGYSLVTLYGWTSESNPRIENCGNRGEVTGLNYVGGIMGYNSYQDGKLNVLSCANKGTIKAGHYETEKAYASGIIGYADNIIVENCYNSGNIEADAIIKNIEMCDSITKTLGSYLYDGKSRYVNITASFIKQEKQAYLFGICYSNNTEIKNCLNDAYIYFDKNISNFIYTVKFNYYKYGNKTVYYNYKHDYGEQIIEFVYSNYDNHIKTAPISNTNNVYVENSYYLIQNCEGLYKSQSINFSYKENSTPIYKIDGEDDFNDGCVTIIRGHNNDKVIKEIIRVELGDGLNFYDCNDNTNASSSAGSSSTTDASISAGSTSSDSSVDYGNGYIDNYDSSYIFGNKNLPVHTPLLSGCIDTTIYTGISTDSFDDKIYNNPSYKLLNTNWVISGLYWDEVISFN